MLLLFYSSLFYSSLFSSVLLITVLIVVSPVRTRNCMIWQCWCHIVTQLQYDHQLCLTRLFLCNLWPLTIFSSVRMINLDGDEILNVTQHHNVRVDAVVIGPAGRYLGELWVSIYLFYCAIIFSTNRVSNVIVFAQSAHWKSLAKPEEQSHLYTQNSGNFRCLKLLT